MLAENRGTCSTKHALLQKLVPGVRLVHRVYRVERDGARTMFGERAAAAVPAEGLVDVHTFAVAEIDGRPTTIDVTFPSDAEWDGRSDMPLACGDGTDYPAGAEPWALKDELVATHCDPALREPFIAALSADDE